MCLGKTHIDRTNFSLSTIKDSVSGSFLQSFKNFRHIQTNLLYDPLRVRTSVSMGSLLFGSK